MSQDDEKVYSVSNFLDEVNSQLLNFDVAIKGEVSSVTNKGHVYFSIKDDGDESVLSCLIWQNSYISCGIELEIGMEIIVRGYPEVYKPTGRFSFKAATVELVGEGALKKAYDLLKKKLELEGIFDVSRKKAIPSFPTKIGLITSREGAVIHDFGNNLGRFGLKIKHYDSRVEGIMAVKQLSEAIRYFRDKDIDVLVVIRGGGSLESLQAFNNESLVREIVDYPVPVLCGIGHDKDVPLFSLAADEQFCTPTAVAKELNKSWEELANKLILNERDLLGLFTDILNRSKRKVSDQLSDLKSNFSRINKRLAFINTATTSIFKSYQFMLKNTHDGLMRNIVRIVESLGGAIDDQKQTLGSAIRLLKQNDPGRQLKLGYSIVFSEGRVIKSVSQVEIGQELSSRVLDGTIVSDIKDIKSKE